MAELKEKIGKKVMALYLPQFHSIPENDEWWGKGFTEWTNTRKAVPLFEGHYQPKIPWNNNYYDLSDVTVMEKQAELAKKYGIYGFCYYHYWFKNGKKLLEKPVENMLKNAKVNIPFCLSWANENWSRNWDGGNREIIMKQEYGSKAEWEKHFQYLLEFFKDKRYITYEGKPLLLIYKPEQIVLLNEMIDYWQVRAKEEGFPGLVIIRQYPESYFEHTCDESRIDYTIKFQPITYLGFSPKVYDKEGLRRKVKEVIKDCISKVHLDYICNKMKKRFVRGTEGLKVYDYDEVWQMILNAQPYEDNLINGAFVSWDNTARKVNGSVIHGATPEKFGDYMLQMLQKESALDIVVINAWNEWAEGAYLEPDERFGYGYLEELQNAIERAKG